ncbi:hypothetical protein PIB30_068461 [Stylosanthes scabra]|uniref:Major facilitator superfamily (MFS) profile domain-containing protein n=1 Tax=Stylosanthes scabra TaxID=79078 RepID=A0ABU6WQQ3_9FABA|nr:hypothetical protein [Stylosanthes scabra]
MVGSTPFLLSYSSSSLSFIQIQDDDNEEQISSINTVVEDCIGEQLNWKQIFQVLLVSFAWFFDGQQTFITIFTDAQPPWHCDGGCESETNKNLPICNLPNDKWSWDQPVTTSIISEWGLQCDGSIITGLPASMFFVGSLIGGLLLATLADSWLGRKKMLFFSCLLMSLSSFLASFSSNVWIYSFLKFLCGFGRVNIGTAAIVLASELVSRKWRSQVGIFGFFLFSLGFLTLPAMAYMNRGFSWRNLYLFTSIPAVVYSILIRPLVCESPRWLIVRGKKEEAIEVLKTITSLPQTQSNLSSYFDVAISGIMPQKEESLNNVGLYSSLKILMQKKWSSRRLMVIIAMGLGIGLVYFGMPLGLELLSFNIYLSVMFNALSEIPSAFLAFILIDKFNRRSVILILTTLSGISSVLSTIEVVAIFNRLQIVFELASFVCACTAYDVLVIYGTELFPTCVRNSALSLVRQAGVLGGTLSPMLVALGRRNKFLCYGVFGLAIGCSGLFSVCLPETKDKAFCDTIDEEESKQEVSEPFIK